MVEGGEYQQRHVIGRAGHPLLKKVVEQVVHDLRHYRQEVPAEAAAAYCGRQGRIGMSLSRVCIRPRTGCGCSNPGRKA